MKAQLLGMALAALAAGGFAGVVASHASAPSTPVKLTGVTAKTASGSASADLNPVTPAAELQTDKQIEELTFTVEVDEPEIPNAPQGALSGPYCQVRLIFTAFCPENNQTAQMTKTIPYERRRRVYNVTLSRDEAERLCGKTSCPVQPLSCEIDVDAEVVCAIGGRTDRAWRARLAQYYARYSQTERELNLPPDVTGQLRSETVRGVMASRGLEDWWRRHGKDLRAYCRALLADNGECAALVTADGKKLSYPCCCGGPFAGCNCRCSGRCRPYRACPPSSSGSWSNPEYHMLIPLYGHSIADVGTVRTFLSPSFALGFAAGASAVVVAGRFGRKRRRRR